MTDAHGLTVKDGRYFFADSFGVLKEITLGAPLDDPKAIEVAEDGEYCDEMRNACGKTEVSATIYQVIGNPEEDEDGIFAVVVQTSERGEVEDILAFFVDDLGTAEDIAKDAAHPGWDGRC